MAEPETEQRLTITKATYVQIGAVVAGLGLLYVPYQWLDSRFAKIEREMQATAVRMDDAMRRIESASQDRWTRTNQQIFALELQMRNPKIVVPEVQAMRESK